MLAKTSFQMTENKLVGTFNIPVLSSHLQVVSATVIDKGERKTINQKAGLIIVSWSPGRGCLWHHPDSPFIAGASAYTITPVRSQTQSGRQKQSVLLLY